MKLNGEKIGLLASAGKPSFEWDAVGIQCHDDLDADAVGLCYVCLT